MDLHFKAFPMQELGNVFNRARFFRCRAGNPNQVLRKSQYLLFVEKGKRKGREVSWATIISGDAELNEALRISVDATRSTDE